MTEMRRVPVRGRRGKRGDARDDAGTPEASEPAADCSCPVLDPAEWHEIESDWSDIAFIGGSVTAILGVPIGYADTRAAMAKRAREVGAEVPEEPMFLMGSGRFRRRVLLEAEGASPGTKRVEFPGGVAFSRLVDAPWGQMQRVVEETKDIALAKYGRKPDNMYVWYLTCRQCSRERNFATLVVAHYRNAP